MKVLAFLAAAYVALLLPNSASAGMLAQAQQYKGLHEIRNNKTLRAVLGINPARTPWCGHFMGLIARKSGRTPPQSFSFARSWLRFGAPVKLAYARAGDIVIVRTGRGYHVGILSALSKSTAQLIGGNQSGGVKVSQFARGQVVGVRR